MEAHYAKGAKMGYVFWYAVVSCSLFLFALSLYNFLT